MAKSEALDIEYENGVADVLAFLAADTAVVERNVKLPGRRSRVRRQIDVLVRGRIFGLTDAVAVVDAKRWAEPVDVIALGAFLDLVEDVGADVGLMVAAKGGSKAAHTRAQEARGVRLEVMSVEELGRWTPPGTFTSEYRIPADKQLAASRALRKAGLRVAPSRTNLPTESEVVISVFRHYGTRSPTAEQQTGLWNKAARAMAQAGISDPALVSHGITINGGTPGHKLLGVAIGGRPIGCKILAATEAEAEQWLEVLREPLLGFGCPSGVLSYIKPEGWPVEGLFAGWAS